MEGVENNFQLRREMPKILEGVGTKLKPTLIFLAMHILLGLLAKQSVEISTLHAWFMFALGAWAALGNRQLFLSCIIGYIVGAEVLWRMTNAGIFWEFGKYAVIGITLIATLVKKRRGRAANKLIIYFLLLLPAILMVLTEPWGQLRDKASFNLSGPFSVVMCGLYFSTVVFDKRNFQKMFTWCVAPIISIAFLALIGVRAMGGTEWRASSVSAASGGFGPNQVAGILGLGVCVCVKLALLRKKGAILRIVFVALSCWFFAQAILTFSRGGVIQAVISLGLFFIIFMKGKKGKYFFIFSFFAVCLASFAAYYLIPKLDAFTSGGVSKRYSEKEVVGGVEIYETTGRLDMLKVDLELFRTNIFGVGVGNSPKAHRKVMGGSKAATHTEWSRLVAEHGVFGLGSLFLLLLWIIQRYRAERSHLFKAIKASFALTACFFMVHAAMRTVLPGFLIGFLGAEFKNID